MRRPLVLTAVVAVVVVVVLLVAAQLFLPGIAQRQLRGRLAQYGTVEHVEVDAFPAVELLWHHADKVVVRMGQYRSSAGALAGQLGQGLDVGALSASVDELTAGLLTLRGATLQKQGDQLLGHAQVDEADLRSAVPLLQSVTPVGGGPGSLTLRGTASLLGLAASVDATVAARGGAILLAPDVPFGGLATITVFSDPHVYVQSISAVSNPQGFALSASARLH